ncbi:hypothetical protein EW145_g1542 [Phellinidium pouzarii]|uniref:F-box domain-containing protein n=1 Tax=Phellinidium pouzarii TaxID=167371 RepID=A0A4S4LEP6_9AGAM|nr:hypothetical protein EW145_g1542 [Phellinidium pouzarii]
MIVPSILSLDNIQTRHVLETFVNARRVQEQSTGLLSTLRVLTQSLEFNVKTFEEIVSRKALRVGLDRLPDEILLLILGHASTTFSKALKLSHVCSRFRSVALSSPRFWNYVVDTNMSDQRLTAILARSGSLPLTVNVSTRWGKVFSETQRSNFEKVLTESGRIRELNFTDMDTGLSQQILNSYSSLQLPTLLNLSVEYRRRYPVSHFYDSWTLPNLKQLKATNFSPRPTLATNITCCSLKYMSHFDIHDMAHFLESASSLQDLTLEFFGIRDSIANNFSGVRSPLATNTSIVSLNIQVLPEASFSAQTAFLTHIGDYIRFPNVTNVSTRIINPMHTNEELESTLPFVFDVPLLKNLAIDVTQCRIGSKLSLGTVLRRAPQCLTTLSLKTMDTFLRLDPENDDQRSVHPQLRTLRFIECNTLDQDFLEAVRADSLKGNIEIERVEVYDCRGILEQNLRDAFPNSNVFWTP